jgi:hypothetical protein
MGDALDLEALRLGATAEELEEELTATLAAMHALDEGAVLAHATRVLGLAADFAAILNPDT